MPVPADQRPGATWTPGPPVEPAEQGNVGEPIRIGYARCSTAQQDLDIQLAALRAAHCRTIFSEKISSRVRHRPEYEKALALAHQFKQAAPHQPVILTVHELKRSARNGAELMALAASLQASGIQLELLTGPLSGIYDPNGVGSMLFAVLANAAQLDRNYIREKTLEGQQAAAAKGNHGGRPKVIDADSLTFRSSAARQRRPHGRDRQETDHQDRQERRQEPLGGLAVPRARRSRGQLGPRCLIGASM